MVYYEWSCTWIGHRKSCLGSTIRTLIASNIFSASKRPCGSDAWTVAPEKASMKIGAPTSRQMHGRLFSKRCDMWGRGARDLFPLLFPLFSWLYSSISSFFAHINSLSLSAHFVTIENDNRKRCRKFWSISYILRMYNSIRNKPSMINYHCARNAFKKSKFFLIF